jgi:hypothetical protein
MWKARFFNTFGELCDWMNENQIEPEQVASINNLTLVYKAKSESLVHKNTLHQDGYY